jgi:hypothetical protein
MIGGSLHRTEGEPGAVYATSPGTGVIRPALVALLALTTSACVTPPPEVRCGPVPPDPCEEQAVEIERVVERDNPGRQVVHISFVNAEGDARVLLDDDTEVGWGERL